MAKSGKLQRYYVVEQTGSEEDEVTLVSLIAARVVAFGASGRRYEWLPGSKVKVLKSDADLFLQERRGSSCCGGSGPKPKFQLIDSEVGQ